MGIDEKAFAYALNISGLYKTLNTEAEVSIMRKLFGEYESAKLPSDLQRNQEIFDMGVEHATVQPDDCREAFEAWASKFDGTRDEFNREKNENGEYKWAYAAVMWEAWKAANALKRESVTHPFTKKELDQIGTTVRAMRIQNERDGLWQHWWIKFVEWSLSKTEGE